MDSLDLNALFDQALTAIKGDQLDEARELLLQVVRADAQHEQAWFWLASVVSDLDQTIDCLQRVLALNPNNAKAEEWLSLAQQVKTKQHKTIQRPTDAQRAVARLGKYLLSHNAITAE